MSTPTLEPRILEPEFPEKLGFLFEPYRYKVAWGGRGGSKSWGFARALLLLGLDKLLSDQIIALGLGGEYEVTKTSIHGRNGTQFIFAGIRQATASNLKSYEGCDIAWVEEAQALTKRSWNILIPTIRKESSEIWASFNPELESDDTYQRFVVSPPESAKVVRIGWEDNPWLPDVLLQEIRDLRKRSEDDYQHIYGGHCKQVVEGAIYREELIAADKEERITRVPYDSGSPVHTFWDLGFGDNTSIWFAQTVGFEFRVIDHESDSLKGLQHYIKLLQEKPYAYGTHWLPHDGAAHELGTGRSIEELLRKVFASVKCARKLSIEDGIAAARAIFGRCWFDREKCADGLQSLRHYRYEQEEKRGTFKREPLHDRASHDADAFRTLGVAIKEFRPQAQGRPSRPATPWS